MITQVWEPLIYATWISSQPSHLKQHFQWINSKVLGKGLGPSLSTTSWGSRQIPSPLCFFISKRMEGGLDDPQSPFPSNILWSRSEKAVWNEKIAASWPIPFLTPSPTLLEIQKTKPILSRFIFALEGCLSGGMLQDQEKQRLPLTDFLSTLMSQVTRQFYRGKRKCTCFVRMQVRD